MAMFFVSDSMIGKSPFARISANGALQTSSYFMYPMNTDIIIFRDFFVYGTPPSIEVGKKAILASLNPFLHTYTGIFKDKYIKKAYGATEICRCY